MAGRMNWLYPTFPARHLPAMARVALVGAIVAGGYGAAHDQISYTISPEYFTKLKFRQFGYADFGWAPRAFASTVGFLATWWVGALAGWFLARAGLIELPVNVRWRCAVRAFTIVLIAAPTAGALGAALGIASTRDGDLSGWRHWQQELGVEDLRAFAIVAWLHAGGYLGALAGLIVSLAYVRRCLSRHRPAASEA